MTFRGFVSKLIGYPCVRMTKHIYLQIMEVVDIEGYKHLAFKPSPFRDKEYFRFSSEKERTCISSEETSISLQ